MISILVCSISEEWRNKLLKSVEETIDYPFEFLYIDNNDSSDGICAVYNKLALKAKGDYLCFCHEDITFNTQAWGQTLTSFASNKEVGVIGFAGSRLMCASSFWYQKKERIFNFLLFSKQGIFIKDNTEKNPIEDFTEVIVLDGLLLFCRKDVWVKHPFDAQLLTGFHLYDMDFSFAASINFKNYICNIANVTHYSIGSFSKAYFDAFVLFYGKWKNYLPRSVKKNSFSDKLRIQHMQIRKMCSGIISKTGLPASYAKEFLNKTDNRSNVLKKIQASFYMNMYCLKVQMKKRKQSS